jgi:predicted HNH restriction endonuclease
LSARDKDEPTALVDLAVVCANCHAMIHRGGKNRKLSRLIPDPRSR